MKEVKEITTQEFIEELRLASEEGLKEFNEDDAKKEYDGIMKALEDVDKAVQDELSLTYKKMMMEQTYKDNEQLQEYIKLLEDLDKARQIQEGAKELYEKMNELNIENYDGAHCKVVLKRPYERRQINSTEFLKDFKPNSDMYKKYVEVKVIKGHVTLKKSEK